MYKELGFVRVGAIVPKLKVANVEYNVQEIIKEVKKLEKKGASIIVTPELSLTGYTCADLFLQDSLISDVEKGLQKIKEETKQMEPIIIVGAPLYSENRLWNCAVVIQNGKILGVVPKTYIPNYAEFYEKRWFASSLDQHSKTIAVLKEEVPFDTNILFTDKTDANICFGIEICEDLWVTPAPSDKHTKNGATMIFNLSASNEIIGKYEYRKDLIRMQSAKTMSAYIYTSSGMHESTTDLLFSGHAIVCENGSILKENERFALESNSIITDIDIQKLINYRRRNTSYMMQMEPDTYQKVPIEINSSISKLERVYDAYPFVPKNNAEREKRCQEIFNIQSTALAKRLLHTNMKKTVIGISGGLDSTLAFLVIVESYKKLGIDTKNIIAITMPGFGTTGRTYENALNLIKEYGATLKEISIKDICTKHYQDIGLDEKDRSITYENAQARERTQILMDVANMENALVIGTGDLSELALGWCTYNGDHMSMYGVNASIPKTLVRYLVEWQMEVVESATLKKTIQDILETPISPELLPPDECGNIIQETENAVGPYVLHDFFLYHFLRYGASPEKIYILARDTFKESFKEEEIKKWLIKFLERFFGQQFKRSCLPDGPKVGTISLSPRGDHRMPSDADRSAWIERLNKL